MYQTKSHTEITQRNYPVSSHSFGTSSRNTFLISKLQNKLGNKGVAQLIKAQRQNKNIIQMVSVTNAAGNTTFDVVYGDGKISLKIGKTEIAYVTYELPVPAVVEQGYIHVNPDYQRQGISYLLTYLGAEYAQSIGRTILYLGGGSLSPSGGLLARKFGFGEYEPSNDKGGGGGGGLCSWLASCFCCGGNTADDSTPLLQGQNQALLSSAYKNQKSLAGGDIPPIKWLPVSDVVVKARAKIAGSWNIT